MGKNLLSARAQRRSFDLVEKKAQMIELEYERPELVEYGDLATLTAGTLHDPIQTGPHGGPHFDPHLTHSS